MDEPGLVARPLGLVALATCASPGYVQAHGLPATLQDLGRHRLVHYQRTLGARPLGFEYEEDGQPRPPAGDGPDPAAWRAALSVKDAQELLSLQANLFQPLAEKTAAYSRHLYDIASGTGAELAKEGIVGSRHGALHHGHGGFGTCGCVLGGGVHQGAEVLLQVGAVKQASDLAEANFTAVTNTASEAVQSAQTRKR